MEGHLKYITNALSTLTIFFSVFQKIPQIITIQQNQSADGLYATTLLMEIAGFSVMTLYNYTSKFNILTYMEYPILLVQIYIMFFYVLKYKNLLKLPIAVGTLLYSLTVWGFASEKFPVNILHFLMPFCTPLSGFAKVSYIYGMVETGNADAISLVTWIISVSTNTTRIFTVYMDSADPKLMFNFFVSSLLSLSVLGTALYYKKYAIRHNIKTRRDSSSSHRNNKDHRH